MSERPDFAVEVNYPITFTIEGDLGALTAMGASSWILRVEVSARPILYLDRPTAELTPLIASRLLAAKLREVANEIEEEGERRRRK